MDASRIAGGVDAGRLKRRACSASATSRRLAGAYLDPAEVETIHRAFLFGADAHDGQHRASGEPYIQHPVQVAKILAEMRLDHETIVAALLHDVIEGHPDRQGADRDRIR